MLTSRPVAKGVRVPMAGIPPYHAVDNYIGRLIDKGYHVAICEQVGEQPEKGLFERDVVRVITPPAHWLSLISCKARKTITWHASSPTKTMPV